MSESINVKLAEIQRNLKAPKGQFNNFGKYKYRSCEDILEALKHVLDGATVTLSDDIISVSDRVYVKATATLSHAGESTCVTAFAREAIAKKGMDDSQITGTASSYARKYALNGLFLIDDTKDADTMDNSNSAAKAGSSLPGDVIAAFQAAKTVDELRALWPKISKAQQEKYLPDLNTRISVLSS